MGNIPRCIVCNDKQRCCDVCQNGYCGVCDYYKNHNQGIAHFGVNTIEACKKSMFVTNDVTKCRADGCYNIGINYCIKNHCCGIFCEDHMDHMHFKCCYSDCSNRAIKYRPDWCKIGPNKWYCKIHDDIVTQMHNDLYESQNYVGGYTAPYGLSTDCRKPLTFDRASIKYCAPCNGKWQALKKQGIKGPFG